MPVRVLAILSKDPKMPAPEEWFGRCIRSKIARVAQQLVGSTLASGGTLAKENTQARQEAAAIRSEIESVQERIANADESVSSSSRRRTSSEKVHEEILSLIHI